MDRFKKLYKEQIEFENLVVHKSRHWPTKPLSEFTEEEKIKFSKELALYLYIEIGEYVQAVGNFKTHKSTKEETDIKNAKEEIADIIIFALDLAIVLDMTAEEILEEVEKKILKNFKRQHSGY